MDYNKEAKPKTHALLGAVLGIIGIFASVFVAYFAGLVGGSFAMIFGLLALMFGINARKRAGTGIAAIITGVLAILLTITLTAFGILTVLNIKQTAAKVDAPLVEKYINPPLGFASIVFSAAAHGEDLDELNRQFNLVTEALEEETKAAD